jgi:predicted nucleic-acid-binding Zn-ribbon protein
VLAQEARFMNLRCDNCGRTYADDSELARVYPDIPDLLARIEPGGIVPYGECPSCGCLVYEEKAASEAATHRCLVCRDRVGVDRFTHMGWTCDGRLVAFNPVDAEDVSDCDHEGQMTKWLDCAAYCRRCGAEFVCGNGWRHEIGSFRPGHGRQDPKAWGRRVMSVDRMEVEP